MAVPKRRKSKHSIGSRRSGQTHKRQTAATAACPSCGAPRLPHRICPSCGNYRGRQVETITAED